MPNTLKKVWNVVATVLAVLMVFCAIFLVGTRLIGFQCYTVISGSMEPEYSVGDLLYVKEVDVNSIKVNDPITFVLNENLVVATHRVVRIDAQNQRFFTKGDANQTEDSEPVHFKNVIGVPKFSIPKLGYVSDFVQNPPGMYITIVVVLGLILLVFLPDISAKFKKKSQDGADDSNDDLPDALEENERLKEEVEKLRAEMAKKDSEQE